MFCEICGGQMYLPWSIWSPEYAELIFNAHKGCMVVGEEAE